mmetsp:Transcript_34712/g.84980  ORF Transcript_34712/g.84980 Transcript_34712/m.84980 type:complete len:475 (+) Transcript_34712:366-1790(+)
MPYSSGRQCLIHLGSNSCSLALCILAGLLCISVGLLCVLAGLQRLVVLLAEHVHDQHLQLRLDAVQRRLARLPLEPAGRPVLLARHGADGDAVEVADVGGQVRHLLHAREERAAERGLQVAPRGHHLLDVLEQQPVVVLEHARRPGLLRQVVDLVHHHLGGRERQATAGGGHRGLVLVAAHAGEHHAVHAGAQVPRRAHRDHHVGEQGVAGHVLEQAVEVAVVEGQRHHHGVAHRQRQLGQHARRQVVGVDHDGVEVRGQSLYGGAQALRHRPPLLALAGPQRRVVVVGAGVRGAGGLLRPRHGAGGGHQVQVGRDGGVEVSRPDQVLVEVDLGGSGRGQGGLLGEERAEDAAASGGGGRVGGGGGVHVHRVLEVADQALGARVLGGVLHGDLQALHGRAESLARGPPQEQRGYVAVQGEVEHEHLLVGPRARRLARGLERHERLAHAAAVVAEAHGVRGRHCCGRSECCCCCC